MEFADAVAARFKGDKGKAKAEPMDSEDGEEDMAAMGKTALAAIKKGDAQAFAEAIKNICS